MNLLTGSTIVHQINGLGVLPITSIPLLVEKLGPPVPSKPISNTVKNIAPTQVEYRKSGNHEPEFCAYALKEILQAIRSLDASMASLTPEGGSNALPDTINQNTALATTVPSSENQNLEAQMPKEDLTRMLLIAGGVGILGICGYYLTRNNKNLNGAPPKRIKKLLKEKRKKN